ncbi:hypothetical protein Ahy_B01g053182 [Arachis hypogaea]|uniref:Ubiquitin-like protease family profile domain-containing protein n=1 Tax=Arachis hypogaea TaxID=3818 RepID=A0A445AR93_ARAHY|nr:hypothetical protein Ahy_B01g053182 [Arachis hypogaea]
MAEDGTGAAFVVQATPELAEILSQKSGVACGAGVDVTPMGVSVGGHATLPILAPDTDEDCPNRQSTIPVMKGKRLFRSPSDKVNRSSPAKRGKSTSSPANTRGHSCENLQYRLTRREIQSLIPGRPIDGAVVDMVAMRNACSIQHLKHPYFWCLPPSFAGLSVVELNEIYMPFWLKPTRFLNRVCVSIHTDLLAFRITFRDADPIGTNLKFFIFFVYCQIFIPIEDIFMHWYCMVVEFGEKTVYHLDSFPDVNMVSDREQLMECVYVSDLRTMPQLEMLYAMMSSPAFGPLRQYTLEDMGRWPIRRGNGIPSCNTTCNLFCDWWLEDITLRGRTAVSLAGGPFNAIGGLVRMWAAKWQRRRRTSGQNRGADGGLGKQLLMDKISMCSDNWEKLRMGQNEACRASFFALAEIFNAAAVSLFLF